MRKRNLLLYYDIFLHLLEYTPPSKIAHIHGVSPQSIHKKIKWMVEEGIIEPKEYNGLYKHKYYVAGPASAAFLKEVEELKDKAGEKNRGTILGAPLPFSSKPSTQPTLDFYSGRAPRIHKLMFVVRLKRQTSRPGLTFRVPSLPDSIKWTKEWEYRGGYKKLGEVKIVGMDRPATVQYFRSRVQLIENITITIPALYVIREWMEKYEDVRRYFYDIAKAIAKQFQQSGYAISDPEPVSKFGEMAFYLPVLSQLPKGDVKKYIRAQKVKENVWLDFSKGFLEIETTDKKEADNITDAIQLLLELPKLKEKVEEHDKILRDIELQYPESSPPGGMYR